MAISLVGEIHVPATENGSNTGSTITIDKDDAAWSGLQAGDIVYVYLFHRNTTGTWSVTTDGGQTWTEEFDELLGGLGPHALYTCEFNGTWTADPVFTVTSGSTLNISGWAFALNDADQEWDVTPVRAADTNDHDIATFDTNTDGAWAILFSWEGDDNTATVDNSFVALSGSGNVYWRNPGGADSVFVICRKLMATAGAVGATVINYSANDPGGKVFAAIKPKVVAAEPAPMFHGPDRSIYPGPSDA